MARSPAALSGEARVVEDARQWDEYISSVESGHLLQSHGWGEFKARYGWAAERYLAEVDGELAAAQVLWRKTPLGPMGYIPRGPAVRPRGSTRAVSALLRGIRRHARTLNATFLKAEPNDSDPAPLPAFGFRPAGQTVQPQTTLMIDLTLDLDELRGRQHSKTRYNINLASKKGVRVRRGTEEDLAVFCALMEETGHRNEFAVRPAAYYRDALRFLGENAELLVAEHEGDLLAGIVLAKFNGEAIYLYGASSSHKRNLMPTYLLQWEAMRRAKEQGLVRYDLWAVPAELAAAARPDAEGYESELPEARIGDESGLWGVYRFKRGFGGRLLSYSGAQDLVYSPPRYWIWQRVVPQLLTLARRRRIAEY